MRIQLFILSFAVIDCVIANNLVKLEPLRIKPIAARQNEGGSFTPGTSPGAGSNCADAFGAGYAECAPSGELSIQECAAKLSVTLSFTSDLETSKQPSATIESPSPTDSRLATPPAVTSTVCTNASLDPPYPTGSPNNTLPSTVGPGSPADLPEFTGAASSQNILQGGVAIVALLGFLENVL
ncbi:predicted protein [Uncinocarpus reesii 1704]|uniref:Uncharacterized protein n=1 Tax=Uncinocarpus reesii (strain UAMH 1704) TaxID=336963 RepID=C4JKL0_UNCRE|nr:uncharacterized protein UREG_02167 [Uncinocarpus reesii 1704]EEP77318.1 predicted protein [Uncinocarpus reesii 1704]